MSKTTNSFPDDCCYKCGLPLRREDIGGGGLCCGCFGASELSVIRDRHFKDQQKHAHGSAKPKRQTARDATPPFHVKEPGPSKFPAKVNGLPLSVREEWLQNDPNRLAQWDQQYLATVAAKMAQAIQESPHVSALNIPWDEQPRLPRSNWQTVLAKPRTSGINAFIQHPRAKDDGTEVCSAPERLEQFGSHGYEHRLPSELRKVHDHFAPQLKPLVGTMLAPHQWHHGYADYKKAWRAACNRIGVKHRPFFLIRNGVFESLYSIFERPATGKLRHKWTVEDQMRIYGRRRRHRPKKPKTTWRSPESRADETEATRWDLVGQFEKQLDEVQWNREGPRVRGGGLTSWDPPSPKYPHGRMWLNTIYNTEPDKTQAVIQSLTNKQRRIATAYYVQNMTQAEIADRYGTHKSRVCEILKRIGLKFTEAGLPYPKHTRDFKATSDSLRTDDLARLLRSSEDDYRRSIVMAEAEIAAAIKAELQKADRERRREERAQRERDLLMLQGK